MYECRCQCGSDYLYITILLISGILVVSFPVFVSFLVQPRFHVTVEKAWKKTPLNGFLSKIFEVETAIFLIRVEKGRF